MFYYDGNNEAFETELAKYIDLRQKDRDKSDYEIGKGWPHYTLADLEQAKGLDGREYGFNPNRMEESSYDMLTPKFEMASIKIGENETSAYLAAQSVASASTETNIQAQNIYAMDIPSADLDYMKNLSGEINKRIQPAIDQAFNEFAYEGSPIMSEKPDREFIGGLVERAMEKAARTVSQVEDIMAEAAAQDHSWNRYVLLRSVFEAAVLKELFMVRRPKYRHILGWQIF